MAMSQIPTWKSPPTPSLTVVHQLFDSHVATKIQTVRSKLQSAIAELDEFAVTRGGGEGQEFWTRTERGKKEQNEVATVREGLKKRESSIKDRSLSTTL